MKTIITAILAIMVFASWVLMYGYALSALRDGTWEPHMALGVFTVSLIILLVMVFADNESETK
jgi:hypothetical protein